MRNHAVPAVRVREVQVLRDGPEHPRAVLDDISFDVGPAEVVGVVGRHGAGTSLLLRALAGQVDPDRGQVRVLGLDPARNAGALARSIAVLPSRSALFDHLTVAESVQLWAALHQRSRDVDEVLELTDLTSERRVPVRRLDLARRQRLQLAVTFVGAAPVVLCDEPDAGSAPGTAAALATLARRHRANGATVVTGNGPDDLEADLVGSWDRVAVLRRGRLVAFARAAELVAEFASQGAATVHLADAAEASALTSTVPGATFQRTGALTRVDVPDCSRERVTALTASLTSVREVHHHDGTLVDAVRRATADRRPLLVREAL